MFPLSWIAEISRLRKALEDNISSTKGHIIWTFEGPIYADRVNGKLTFRDWDHWTKEDQDKWRDDAPKD